jgi:hypothetical protein
MKIEVFKRVKKDINKRGTKQKGATISASCKNPQINRKLAQKTKPIIKLYNANLLPHIPHREPMTTLVHGDKVFDHGHLRDREVKLIKPEMKPKIARHKYKEIDLLIRILNKEDEDEKNVELENILLRLHTGLPKSDSLKEKLPFIKTNKSTPATTHMVVTKSNYFLTKDKLNITGEQIKPKLVPKNKRKKKNNQGNAQFVLKTAPKTSRELHVATIRKQVRKQKPLKLTTKDRHFLEFTSTIYIERLLRTTYQRELYQDRFNSYETNKLKVTRQKIDGCLTRLLIKDRRNLLHKEYKNPKSLVPPNKNAFHS